MNVVTSRIRTEGLLIHFRVKESHAAHRRPESVNKCVSIKNYFGPWDGTGKWPVERWVRNRLMKVRQDRGHQVRELRTRGRRGLELQQGWALMEEELRDFPEDQLDQPDRGNLFQRQLNHVKSIY